MNGGDAKLNTFIKRLLSSNGLDVKDGIKVSRRFSGEGYGVVPIESLDKFIRLFGEGRYYIACTDVNVRGVEEHPYSIAYLLIDAEYKDSKWTIKLFADEEDIYDPDIGHLEKRRQKLKKAVESSLEFFTFFG